MNLCRISRNTVPALCLFFLLFFLVFRFPAMLSADVVTDGTMGPAQSLNGPDFQIPHDLGKTAGQNLFHSFQKFSISNGQSATFTGPDSIQNVISRVTGGEISSIDGLLRSQVGKADFFFINPSGVVFGPNAQVDVPAAFHISTADELRFADGSVFSAANPGISTLTAATPESFGFLSPQTASIVLNGSHLEFKAESRVSLTGGDVSISGTTEQNAELVSEAGEIHITAAGGQTGVVPVSGKAETEMKGSVNLESAILSSGGSGGGHIVIQAGNAELNAATVWAFNTGSRNATDGVWLQVDECLEVLNGAQISSDTFGEGNAGSVKIQAGNLRIDDQGAEDQFTRISSDTYSGSGNAGTVDITVANLLEIVNGAKISSDTFAEGNAGSVKIQSGNLRIDDKGNESQLTGISSSTYFGSGNAGTVDITVASLLEIISGAMIFSDTFTDGNAGDVKIQAENLKIDDQGNASQVTGIFSRAHSGSSGNAGTVDITVGNFMEMLSGAEISSSTSAGGCGGNVNIQAENLRIDGQGAKEQFTGISSSALTGSAGDAGTVDITVSNLMEIINGAIIWSDTFADGNAGDVKIQAENLKIDKGPGDQITCISSSTHSGSGNAGTVDITVGNLMEINNGAIIWSSTSAQGCGGRVKVHAGNLRLDGGAENQNTTGISSSAFGSGNAGTVNITVGNFFEMLNGATVSSLSGAQGDGGTVEITVGNLLEIKNGAEISTGTVAQGKAGNVTVQACELIIDGHGFDSHLTGISSITASSGDAGMVNITVADHLEILNGAYISTSTADRGNAGSVTIHAGNLKVDGGAEKQSAVISSDSSGSGNSGTVDITVGNLFKMINGAIISSQSGAQGDGGTVNITVGNFMEILNGAVISSSTGAQGNAGEVIIHAGDLKIDGQGFEDHITGVASSAALFSSGNSGTVDITVDNLLEVLNGATITSNTAAKGDAGEVKIVAGEVRIDDRNSGNNTGITGGAHEEAGGHVGDVTITADTVSVLNGGKISIAANQILPEENLSGIPETAVRIDTGSLHLDQNSRITAESTGNVPAAQLNIQANALFVENNSRITTSANEADGGPIFIQGETLMLRDGLITTSVEGENGNGGNITVSGTDSGPAGVLVFDGGFIQANTAAENAKGGDISIDAKAVIADRDSLEVGGAERQEFEPGSGGNIIQAAAPGGEQGSIDITAPNLNISGALVNISSGFAAPVTPSADPCRAASSQNPSSLVLKGRGGIPPDPDHFSVLFFGIERLERLTENEPDKTESDQAEE